jgi:F-box interacting protein
MPPFSPAEDVVRVLAHCDGLLLLSSGKKLRVLNPATRRFVTLPWSTHSIKPDGLPIQLYSHQEFGLGCDPASNTYKVARYFYRSAVHLPGGHYQYNLGMEVFTIGTEHRWRETATPPASWPVMTRRTATFFKGSLLWTIDESFLGATPGFIRFSVEDESFTAVPPPPCWIPELDYKEFSLAELRGELCLCVHRRPSRTMEMWVCNDLGTSGQTPWERRYVLANVARPLRLLGMFSEEMVFKGAEHILAQKRNKQDKERSLEASLGTKTK